MQILWGPLLLTMVRFNATFSGLQKAEKLHNMYTGNHLGVAEYDAEIYQYYWVI